MSGADIRDGDLREALSSALKGKGLPPGEEAFLLRFGSELRLRAGRQFAWQDDGIDKCLIVLSGRISVTKHRVNAPSIALPQIARGEWACLAEVIARAPSQADYAAIEECVCLSFSPFNLAAVRQRPQIESWISLCMARGALALHSFLAEGGPRERIVSWLLARRRVVGGVESSAVATTQAEIARSLGLSRETVNRRLAEFEAQGLLSTRRSEVAIPDWDALERSLKDEDA